MAEYPEKIFIGGLSSKPADIEKMPWLKLKVGINVKQFAEFCKEHADERGWLNMLVSESKNGGLYFELDQFKPKKLQKPESLKNLAPDDDIDLDSIPF